MRKASAAGYCSHLNASEVSGRIIFVGVVRSEVRERVVVPAGVAVDARKPVMRVAAPDEALDHPWRWIVMRTAVNFASGASVTGRLQDDRRQQKPRHSLE